MIVKINGEPITSAPDAGGFLGWINSVGDSFIDKEVETILRPIAKFYAEGINWTFHGIADIMPELATIAVLVCVTIGMFTNFSKWAARGAAIYLGGAVWIILASTV